MQEKAEKTMGYEILSESNNQQLSDFNLLCLKFGSGGQKLGGGRPSLTRVDRGRQGPH